MALERKAKRPSFGNQGLASDVSEELRIKGVLHGSERCGAGPSADQVNQRDEGLNKLLRGGCLHTIFSIGKSLTFRS